MDIIAKTLDASTSTPPPVTDNTIAKFSVSSRASSSMIVIFWHSLVPARLGSNVRVLVTDSQSSPAE